MTSTKKLASNPPAIFLALGLLIGVLYSIVIPYGAGFDESEHLTRIYDLAGAHLLPNRNPPTYKATLAPQVLFALSYQRRFIQSPAFDMFEQVNFGRRISDGGNEYVYGYQTRSIYSPVIFLPQAVIARLLWLRMDLPVIPVVILMRLAGLLVYMLGVSAAIRVLPFGKWMLMVLALSPMAMFQASTLNADGFTNAVSFLFIAACLAVYAHQQENRRSEWALLLASVILLGFAKPGTVILLLLLFILPRDRSTSKKSVPILWIAAAISILVNAGWMALAVPYSHFSSGGNQSISEQLALIFANPGDFILMSLGGLFQSLLPYFKDWIAAYGYWAGIVPGPVYVFFVLLLIAVTFLECPVVRLPRSSRWIMLAVFIAACSLTIGLYLVANYSPGAASPLGRQGRYFIPYAPLLFLLHSNRVSMNPAWQKLATLTAIFSFAFVFAFYSFGIYTTYYTYCGTRAYMGGKCSLPIYKNLDTQSLAEVRLAPGPVSQTFTNHCDGLESVAVLVNSAPTGSQGTLVMSVLDDRGEVLSTREISFDQLAADTYVSLAVPGRPGDRGIKYEIRLQDASPADAGTLSFRTTDGGFPDGKLFIAGTSPGRQDLVFHYVCAHP